MKIMQFCYTKIYSKKPVFWTAVVMVVFLICSYVDIFVIGIHKQSMLNAFVPAVAVMTYFGLTKITEQQKQIDDLKRELEEMKKQAETQS